MSLTLNEFVDTLTVKHFPYVECPILYRKNKNAYTWQVKFIMKCNDKYFDFTQFTDVTSAMPPLGYILIYSVEYGMDKKNTNITEVTSGKNIGKKNETSVLIQGLHDIKSLYDKKLSSGYSLNKSNGDAINSIDELFNKNNNVFVYGMNLYNYTDVKPGFPLIAQRKYNGLSATLILYHNKCIMYSRQHKLFDKSVVHIINEFKNKINISNVYFIGELYTHGLDLQSIMSLSRKNVPNDKLEFVICDYYEIGVKTTANDRMNTLNKYITDYNNLKYIKFAPTQLIINKSELNTLMNESIKDGYEGLVLRIPDKYYEYNITNPIRSKSILKYKKIYEDNFPLISYTVDKYGGIVFICAQSSQHNNDALSNRKTFNVVPNWTTNNRIIAYNNMSQSMFDSKFYGHLVKVYYNDLSKDKIPLQAKMEIFVEENLFELLVPS